MGFGHVPTWMAATAAIRKTDWNRLAVHDVLFYDCDENALAPFEIGSRVSDLAHRHFPIVRILEFLRILFKEDLVRNLLVGLVAVGLAMPLAVSAQQGGVTAEGWQARLDQGSNASAALAFRTMGGGVHASTGGSGAAIFWQPNSMAKGNYTISASFTLTKPSNHPNGYGLVLGGSDLSGPDQRYTYFVVRQDGRFLIKKRNGGQTPTVVNWTPHAAIAQPDGGTSTNVLSVEVGATQVRFLVNGTEVSTQPRSAVDTEGTTGLRVNHFLDVHIDNLELSGT